MQIFVKTFSGKLILLDVDGNDNIGYIKELIYNYEGILCDKQRLIFGCKQLNDKKRLNEYNINNECTLDCVLTLNGGSDIPDDDISDSNDFYSDSIEDDDNESIGDSDADADDECYSVVIDNGTGFIKAGFSGINTPRTIFPAIIGQHTFRGNQVYHVLS